MIKTRAALMSTQALSAALTASWAPAGPTRREHMSREQNLSYKRIWEYVCEILRYYEDFLTNARYIHKILDLNCTI
jgi:hypothetical protein